LCSLAACDDEVRPAVLAYVEAARAGRPIAPLHADEDTSAATATLAASHGFSVDSWITDWKDGNACYWTTVDDARGAHVKVNILVEKEQAAWNVSRVSTTRPCSCPRGFPCRMKL